MRLAFDWVTDGSAALASVAASQFELVLLEIGLPKKDGGSVLKQIRQSRNYIPIIMITARDAAEDCIAGFDFGAYDYLVKPFLIEELMARIRAVARRHSGNAQPVLSNGVITIDPAAKSAMIESRTLELTGKEYRFFHSLLLTPDRIFSKDALEEKGIRMG